MERFTKRGAKITPYIATVGATGVALFTNKKYMGFNIFNPDNTKVLSYSLDGGVTYRTLPPTGSHVVEENGTSIYVKGSATASPYELTVAFYQ